MVSLFVTFTLAIAIGLILTPMAIWIAKRCGILDVPVDDRRVHSAPTPRFGGAAVVLSTVLAVSCVLIADTLGYSVHVTRPSGEMFVGITLACGIIFVVGVLDDLRGVAPRFKLAAQTAAALIVVAYGIVPQSFSLGPGGSQLHLGFATVPLVVFWIVGITNAFNLIDGIDGLAGSFGILALGTCMVSALVLGNDASLLVVVAATGALLSFLHYNRHPARIFLGDAGSMTIGFFLAVESVNSATASTGSVYFLIPLVALAFPITDTFIAIARRWVRGHPFSRADGRHIHHQLLALGLSTQRTVELLVLVFFCVAAVGLSVVLAPPRFTLALFGGGLILGAALALYSVQYLRYSEFMHFAFSALSAMRSARSVVQHKLVAEGLASQIANSSSLREIEALLDGHAGVAGALQVQILSGKHGFTGPEAQLISPADQLPWRLDYRMGLGDAQRREVLLRIWCSTPSPGIAHGSAERLALRVGPAIEQWIRSHPEILDELSLDASGLAESSDLATGRHSGSRKH